MMHNINKLSSGWNILILSVSNKLSRKEPPKAWSSLSLALAGNQGVPVLEDK